MKKRNIITAVVSTIIFIVYTMLLIKVDVKPIGPNGSSVGFAKMNGWFRDLIGQNNFMYKLSELLGIILLLFVFIYACIGLYQLIKRKSLFKIDREIIILGCFYVVVFALYILFDKVAINYRHVLLEGVLEPSFPSSHTLLAMFVCGSAVIMNNKLFEKNEYKKIINVLIIVLMVFIIVGRLLSGVHWITDVVGGILIATTLLYIFNYIINYRK